MHHLEQERSFWTAFSFALYANEYYQKPKHEAIRICFFKAIIRLVKKFELKNIWGVDKKMNHLAKQAAWLLLAILGACSLGVIALSSDGEP